MIDIAEVTMDFLGRLRDMAVRQEERKAKNREDFLEDILDDLEVVSLAVTKLDNLFIGLVREFQFFSYGEEGMKVITKTNEYLNQRKILPVLDKRIGILEELQGQKEKKRIRNIFSDDFFSDLQQLNDYLSNYRGILGDGGPSGVGRYQLEYMVQMTSEPRPYAEISETAQQTLLEHDFTLSNEIHNLLGKLRLHIRTAKLK